MSRRIAWVTGGGSGIGKALAETLYQEGWSVVISGRRKEVLEATVREIKEGSEALLALAGDVSDGPTVSRIVEAIQERWGNVDLLINNAGENPHHTFEQATPEEFEHNFRVNCVSAIRCVKAVLPSMRTRRSGTIVNVSSVLGRWASSGSPAYSVSKYAVAGFNDSLRQELAGSGIHVMGVYPGFIRTAMTSPYVKPGSAREKVGKTPEAMAQAILKGIRRKKSEVLFPWYVPIVLHLYQLFPKLMESFRKKSGN